MLHPGFKWEPPTKTKPCRDFVDEEEDATNKMAASQNARLLDLMLGQMANYCPVTVRSVIMKKCTSLDDVWHTT